MTLICPMGCKGKPWGAGLLGKPKVLDSRWRHRGIAGPGEGSRQLHSCWVSCTYPEGFSTHWCRLVRKAPALLGSWSHSFLHECKASFPEQVSIPCGSPGHPWINFCGQLTTDLNKDFVDTRTLPDAGENVQELDLSYIAGGNVKWDNQSGKSWQFLKNSNPLGGNQLLYPGPLSQRHTYVLTNPCVWIFITALWAVTPNWKQPSCPLTGEWLRCRTFPPWHMGSRSLWETLNLLLFQSEVAGWVWFVVDDRW